VNGPYPRSFSAFFFRARQLQRRRRQRRRSSDFVSVIWHIGVRRWSSWERCGLHHYRLELRGPTRDVHGEGGGPRRCKWPWTLTRAASPPTSQRTSDFPGPVCRPHPHYCIPFYPQIAQHLLFFWLISYFDTFVSDLWPIRLDFGIWECSIWGFEIRLCWILRIWGTCPFHPPDGVGNCISIFTRNRLWSTWSCRNRLPISGFFSISASLIKEPEAATFSLSQKNVIWQQMICYLGTDQIWYES
jgi:hypothetical protein